MSHLPEVTTNPSRTSNESLNFQLAQPVIPPVSTGSPEAKLEESEKPESEKTYLETEIDFYSGLDFKNKQTFPISIRPSTLPKPTLRAFTFGSTNPFTVGSTEIAPNNDLYTTVNKPKKSRPAIPPKTFAKQIKAGGVDDQIHLKRLSTTSLFDNSGEPNGKTRTDDANLMQKVSSLPDLAPLQLVQVGNRLHPVNNIQRNSTIGYGIINKTKENGTSLEPLLMVGNSDNLDYCDMIPESPPYINELVIDSENVYEDVKISSPKPSSSLLQQKIPSHKFVSEILNKTPDGDYTKMVSPLSDVSFSFQGFSIYENLPGHLPSKVDINASADPTEEVLEPPLQFSSPGGGYPIIPDSNCAPDNLEYNTSQSPYYANSETISHRQLSEVSPSPSSSVASTVASSFQGIQVCYFPPQRPADFYGDFNTCGLPSGSIGIPKRPGSASDFSTASSSDISRRSSTRPTRSRIPVPVKSPRTPDNHPAHHHITVPEEPAPPLPPTPSPSPALIPKNKKKSKKQDIILSPPSPPTGKSARWYEKLGCIQTDTIQPTEPYGVPGERKRSKSLNKEHRKSKFFVPVEPNDNLPDTCV